MIAITCDNKHPYRPWRESYGNRRGRRLGIKVSPAIRTSVPPSRQLINLYSVTIHGFITLQSLRQRTVLCDSSGFVPLTDPSSHVYQTSSILLHNIRSLYLIGHTCRYQFHDFDAAMADTTPAIAATVPNTVHQLLWIRPSVLIPTVTEKSICSDSILHRGY